MKNNKLLSVTLEKYWKNYTRLVQSSRKKMSIKNIHQLRIATQRIEAVLSLFGSLENIKDQELITDLLKKVRKSLGPLRDSHVELPMLDDIVGKKLNDKASKKLIELFKQDEQQAQKKAQKALDSIHLKREKLIVEKLSKSILELETVKNEKQIKNKLDQKMKSSVLKFNLLLSKIDPDQMKDIHTFRIFAKKLRYQGECLQSLEKKTRFSLKKLKKVQSIAGQIQNDTVLLNKLNQFRLVGDKNDDLFLEKTCHKIGLHRDQLIKKDFSQLGSLKWVN